MRLHFKLTSNPKGCQSQSDRSSCWPSVNFTRTRSALSWPHRKTNNNNSNNWNCNNNRGTALWKFSVVLFLLCSYGQLTRAWAIAACFICQQRQHSDSRAHGGGSLNKGTGVGKSSEGGADDSWTLSLPNNQNNQTTTTTTSKVCVFFLENVNQLNESNCRQSRLSSTRIYPTECKNNKNNNNSRTQRVILNRTQLNLTHLFAPRSSWDEPSSTGQGLVLWDWDWDCEWDWGLGWAGRPLADTCAGWLIR